MTTLLFLGASIQQLAPIEYAKSAGYRIITCDNRPDNPGHKFAHKYYNISTIDKEGVLNVAKEEKVHGIVCYASDVSAPAAAYVCEKLGLPGNPYESVKLLTHKFRFRQFQKENGFFCPASFIVEQNECRKNEILPDQALDLRLPVIVKPIDANASKGVSKVHQRERIIPALVHALEYSISKKAIVEEYIERKGYQVCGDGFLMNGKIIFHSFGNEHFKGDSVVPIGESFPSIFDDRLIEKSVETLQQIFDKLEMSQGAFNVDLMFTENNDVFIVEIGPRNGGNRIPEALIYANHVDTVKATVEIAIGNHVDFPEKTQYFYSTYSIHAIKDGVLDSIEFLNGIEKNIVDQKIFHEAGDEVSKFNMGSNMIGNLILKYDTYTDMLYKLDHMDDYVKVNLR